MMKKMYLTLLLLFTASMSFAQGSFTKQQVAQMIEESTVECKQYAGGNYDEMYHEWFNRMRIVSIKKLSRAEVGTMQNINNMELRNKCNPSYRYQLTDLKRFNPLMYHLHFETPTGIRYLLGDTGYYLEILPKK